MLNEKIDTLIFDLDNTLVNRNLAMRQTLYDWMFTQRNYDNGSINVLLDDIMLKDQWGYTDRISFCSWLITQYGNNEAKQMGPHQLFIRLLKNIVSHISPDEYLISLLRKLSSTFRLVLATNGNSVTQLEKLVRSGLQEFFENRIFISSQLKIEKPDKRFFERIITGLSITPQHALVIGDHPVNDIEAAQQCGFNTCWLSYERIHNFKSTPDFIIKEITAIAQWMTD